MKRWMLCLTVLLACSLPCAAQKASGPFADVPPNTWPFAAVETLGKAGIVLGYPDGTYGGRHAVTRYEFAVATARILIMSASLPPEASSNLATDVPIRLKASPLAVSALIALVNEFSPELIRLGQDVPKTNVRLEAWQQQQRQDIEDGKIVLTPEQLKSPFADVSQTDPARPNEDILIKSGIVMAVPDSAWNGCPPETRLQMAGDVARLYGQLSQPSDMTDRFQQSPPDTPALRSLTTEFAPELKLLGQDVTALQAKLAALTAPAGLGPSDVVPRTDPAWHNVDVLQKAGIVIGYPDGTYGGRRVMTRYVFAVAIARLLSQLPSPTQTEPGRLGRAKDLVDRLTSGPEVSAALAALVEEFRPELTRLAGPGGTQLAQLALPLPAYLIALKQRIAELPENQLLPTGHWAYQALGALDQAGVSFSQTHLKPDERLTPRQIASLLGFWLNRLPAIPTEPDAVRQQATSGEEWQGELREARRRLQMYPAALAALTRLVGEFAPELQEQGEDVNTIKSRLAWLATKPFPDVSERHWAADATVTMRQYGLLKGYPQGTFSTF